MPNLDVGMVTNTVTMQTEMDNLEKPKPSNGIDWNLWKGLHYSMKEFGSMGRKNGD